MSDDTDAGDFKAILEQAEDPRPINLDGALDRDDRAKEQYNAVAEYAARVFYQAGLESDAVREELEKAHRDEHDISQSIAITDAMKEHTPEHHEDIQALQMSGFQGTWAEQVAGKVLVEDGTPLEDTDE